jgi:methyltransferase (TIGR00027 family)
MKESRTALGVAWMRAVHQLLDPEPRILVDPPIVDLLGRPVLAPGSEMTLRMQTPGARLLRSHVVLRSRFAEDRLAESRERGVSQYVILGAGYDTFFARQPGWAASMRLVEIDQPATQQDKLAKITAAGIAVPSNVTFGSVDFEAESLASGLRRHAVSFDQPTFFSWLGVSMYLTGTAIDATLATVRSFPRGSEIVLTFASRPAAADLDATGGAASRLAQMAAAVGEPWISYFEPAEIAGKLRDAGFSEVSLLTPTLAAGRYFVQQDLPLPMKTSIVSAVV